MTEENKETGGSTDGEKPETKPETKPENKGSKDGETGGSGDGDSGKSGEKSLAGLVQEEVKKALEGAKSLAGFTPRRQDIEAEAERMVREAAAKLKAEEDHANDHAKLKETAKEAVEEAPKKVRKLTKLLWGEIE